MNANDNFDNRDSQVIPVASCRSPYSDSEPSYRVARIDFTDTKSQIIVLECLQTGEHYKSTLHEVCADKDFLKSIDSESCYRLGYMKGLQAARRQASTVPIR